VKFTWDPGKEALNLEDHSVTFAEALTVFGDSLARIHHDPDHSEGESREIIVGYSSAGRLLLVWLHGKNQQHPAVFSQRSDCS
jgi:uncharacterized protein